MKRFAFFVLVAVMSFSGCSQGASDVDPNVSASPDVSVSPEVTSMPYDEGEILWEDLEDKFFNANTTYNDVEETATIEKEEVGDDPVSVSAVTLYDNNDPNITVYSSSIVSVDGVKKDLVVFGEEAKSNVGDGWVNDNPMFYDYLMGPSKIAELLYENSGVNQVFYEGVDEGFHKFVFDVNLVKAGIQYYADEGEAAGGTFSVWLNDQYMIKKLFVSADDRNFGRMNYEYVYDNYNSGAKVVMPE